MMEEMLPRLLPAIEKRAISSVRRCGVLCFRVKRRREICSTPVESREEQAFSRAKRKKRKLFCVAKSSSDILFFRRTAGEEVACNGS